jgi:predicted alpha/beta-hydrolase family hydrolase
VTWIAAKPELWDGRTAIILGHGAGQGMNSPFMNYFHLELSRRGFLSVKFDFEYMEQGRKVPDPQPKLQARYREVVDEVLAAHKPEFLAIGGKSMGGRVASYIAATTPGVRGLLFLGYPLHPPGKQDKLRDQHLYSMKLPMLFVSGTRDTFAERGLLEAVVRKIGVNATLFWVEGGDHSLKKRRSDSESLVMAAEEIERWVVGPLRFGSQPRTGDRA